MSTIALQLDELFSVIRDDVERVLNAPAIPLATANPSSMPGVYVLSYKGKIRYVGEAKGSKGLRDRLLSKHVSGDDGHAIQRAFAGHYPDRQLRRAYIRENVLAQWIEIADAHRVSAVERVLIGLLRPEWNVR